MSMVYTVPWVHAGMLGVAQSTSLDPSYVSCNECRWERLENGAGGRDDIVRTALRLAQLDVVA